MSEINKNAKRLQKPTRLPPLTNTKKLNEAILNIGAYDMVSIAVPEYRNLVACRAMLDMILDSIGDDGYADSVVVKCAKNLREQYA